MPDYPSPLTPTYAPDSPVTLSGALTTRREQALTEKDAARISGQTARSLARVEADHLVAQAEEWSLSARTRQQVLNTGAEYDLATSIASENPAAANALHAILSSATARRVDRNLRGR